MDRRLGAGAAVLAAALLFSAGVLGLRPAPGGGPEAESGVPVPPAGPIDLNLAGAQELDLLPGIGPERAAAILEYRAQHGPFQQAGELLEVPGMGEALLDGLRDYVRAEALEDTP